MTTLKLPRLSTGGQIADKDGKPSKEFTRFWNEFATAIETGVNDIAAAQAAAVAAQSAADAAQVSADAAAAAAGGTSNLQSLQQSGVDENIGISSSDTGGPSADITITGNTRYYGDGTSVFAAGGNIPGLVNATNYWIYYDDPTRAGGSVTYAAATSSATAFPTPDFPDRHYVGKILSAPIGGPDTAGEPNLWA